MPAWAYLEVPSDLNFSITEVRNFLLEGNHPDSTGIAPTSTPVGSSVTTSSSQLASLASMPSDAISWSSLATSQTPASVTASPHAVARNVIAPIVGGVVGGIVGIVVFGVFVYWCMCRKVASRHRREVEEPNLVPSPPEWLPVSKIYMRCICQRSRGGCADQFQSS